MTPTRLVTWLLVVLPAAGCSRSPVAPVDPWAPTTELSERLETAHMVFHYAPGDFVDVQRTEAYCTWAGAFLGVALPQKIDYYKWKDRQAEWLLSQATVTGLAQPSSYTVWAYLPWMNHELFHIYSLQVGRPTTFFSEGIAVAYQIDPFAGDFVAREKNGVPVHDVVRQLKAQGRLLPFTSFVTSSGWNSSDYTITYDEAGSFVRYMVDQHGIDRMTQVFRTIVYGDSAATVSTRLQAIYGFSLAEAEARWLAFLGT
jgi:hypothetical protein